MAKPLPPIVSIVGMSNVGKTTLIVKLVQELKRRGYRVATIKHHARGFELDRPGKDSWRFTQAGSDVVLLAAESCVAMIRRVEHNLTIDEVAAFASDVDIVLVEGYKASDKPRIEVSRLVHSGNLISRPEELLALAADYRIRLDVPQYDLDDAAGLVDLLEAKFCLSSSHSNTVMG